MNFLKYIVLFLVFLCSFFFYKIANASDVYDFLSGWGIYAKVKKDAGNQNQEVFRVYEKATSKKVIAACVVSSVSYTVVASWGLNINSKQDAEDEASDLCSKNSPFGSWVLIGYKVHKNIKF